MSEKIDCGAKVARLLELPPETAGDWPKIILDANRRVLIQNHRGIIEYNPNLFRVKTRLGEIKISGNGLNILAAHRDELLVDGEIVHLELVDWR